MVPLKQCVTELLNHCQIESVIEQLPLGLFIADSTGLCCYVNPAWRRMTGLTFEEALGTGWQKAIHPEDRTRVFSDWEAAVSSNSVFAGVYRYCSPEGAVCWVSCQAQLLTTDTREGQSYFLGLVADVTDSRRHLAELERTNLFLDSIIENIPAMIFVKDAADLRFVRFNHFGEELLGIGRAELIGKNDYDFFPAEQATFFIEKDREVLQRGELCDIPVEPIETRRNGQRLLHTRKVPICGSDGVPLYLLGISVDITDSHHLHQALERNSRNLEAIIENSPGVIYRCSHETSWIVEYLSPSISELFGYEASDFIGRSVSKIASVIDDEDRMRVFAEIEEATRHGKPWEIEFRVRHADGDIRWVIDRGHALRNKEGSIEAYQGFILDVTSRIHTRNELIRAKAELEYHARELESARDAAQAAAKAKSQFLANMSHEIRTPLNGIAGTVVLLNGTPLSDEQRDYLRILDHSVKALSALIDDILDFSKIEAGRIVLDIHDFELGEFLQRTISPQEKTIRDKSIEFILEVDPRLPKVLYGDSLRFGQIVTNLLSNAVKFTPIGGSIRLMVEQWQRVDHKVTVRISVSDTGIGIPSEMIDTIFDAFAQGDPSTTRRFGGTGLGLAIVKRLIALMDGYIRVESEVGKGSTFTVTIPFALSPLSTLDTSEQSRKLRRAVLGRELNLRILLAEDNLINEKVTRSFLEKNGCRVSVAPNGAEVLSLLERMGHDAFDVILMDCQMPIMSGYEATQEIRRREQALGNYIPIIALTANAFKEDRQRCFEAGMDGYLSKPLDLDDLLQVLERIRKLNVEL